MALSHLSDLMFHQKKFCMRHDAWVGVLSWWSCQSPAARSCSLLYHPNSFHKGMFKLNAKFDADSLLYLISHFECDGHTVHMLTQWCLLPPLTSTVKSSLFMYAHSSPLSLAARSHQCHENHSFMVIVGLFLDRPHICEGNENRILKTYLYSRVYCNIIHDS